MATAEDHAMDPGKRPASVAGDMALPACKRPRMDEEERPAEAMAYWLPPRAAIEVDAAAASAKWPAFCAELSQRGADLAKAHISKAHTARRRSSAILLLSIAALPR